MTTDTSNHQRRVLLQAVAGLAALSHLSVAGAGAPASPAQATGKAGDFDFLSGEWKIRHRRLKDVQWSEFEGEATVVPMLGGIASVEELRIPSQHFSGMGLRLLDVERRLWADYWVNSKNGVMNPAATMGCFTQGVGIWDAPDVDGGKPIIVRGVWDQITVSSCRWYQAVSRENGKTWEDNWVMQWVRA